MSKQSFKKEIKNLINEYLDQAPPGATNNQVNMGQEPFPAAGNGLMKKDDMEKDDMKKDDMEKDDMKKDNMKKGRGRKPIRSKRAPTEWQKFLKKFISENKGMPFVEAVKAASAAYKKGGVASAPIVNDKKPYLAPRTNGTEILFPPKSARVNEVAEHEEPVPIRPEPKVGKGSGKKTKPNTQNQQVVDLELLEENMFTAKHPKVKKNITALYKKRAQGDRMIAGGDICNQGMSGYAGGCMDNSDCDCDCDSDSDSDEEMDICEFVGGRLNMKMDFSAVMELLKDSEMRDLIMKALDKSSKKGGTPIVGGKKKPLNNYIKALKAWNKMHKGKWCVPKKGSKEYDEVMTMKKRMDEGKAVVKKERLKPADN